MKNSWNIFLVLISSLLVSSAQVCNPNDDCVCYPEQEIHCPTYPLDEENIDTHLDLTLQRTAIKCYNTKNFRMDLLPNVTAEDNIYLDISSCPLPVDSFKEIAEHFSMNRIEKVRYENWNENVILTKQYFEGLNLDSLELSKLNFGYIDAEVFSDLPDLKFLAMWWNQNLTLTSKFFQNLTNLSWLYLGENGLEHLPKGLFSNLGNLLYLFLLNNKLKMIQEETFFDLPNLTFLMISNNTIENISEKSFQNLKKFNFVHLAENRLGNVSADIFKNNENIKIIFLDHNPSLQLPDYFFANSNTLQTVGLSHCNLSSIPEHVFKNSINLRTIDLDTNKLTKIPSNLFDGLVKLRFLHFQNNLITEINGDIFKDLSGLVEINLSKNLISTVQYGTFHGTRKLEIINLSHNRYSDDSGSNIFEDLPKVTKLDLSHNLLTKIEHVVSPHIILELKELDLRNNKITEIWLTHLQSAINMRVYLDNNNITRIHIDNIEDVVDYYYGKSTISLTDNPFECTCGTFELTQFLRGNKYQEKLKMFEILTETLVCESPQKLQGQSLTDLSQSALDCDLNDCPLVCSCSWRPFDKSVIIDCQNKNLTEFPFIGHSLNNSFGFNQTELHLEGNYLESGPNMSLEGYNNVTKLYISHNRIRKIENLPPKLEVLHLDNNRLSSLGFGIIDILDTSILVDLTLHNNNWVCDCNSVDLTNFLRQHSELVNADNIKCYKSTQLLLNLTEADLCSNNITFYIVIPVLGIMLFITILVVIFYRYQQEIKVWLFAHDFFLWWVTEEEVDRDKLYDAFISYSHKDESFVMERLVPVLQSGPTPYKLCLHLRDWAPGEFISTQITNSVLQSRRTVIVLSPNFLDSVWGKMEFRTAHMHAMTEGRTRVIMVVYGDINMNKLDNKLKSYMRTNTYVKWGDPYFWDKIRYALPHSKI